MAATVQDQAVRDPAARGSAVRGSVVQGSVVQGSPGQREAEPHRAKPGRPAAPRYGWQDRAACEGVPLGVFFGPEGERPTARRERERQALAICARCPVRDSCLEHALALPEAYGVWGGVNEAERAERRRRERAA